MIPVKDDDDGRVRWFGDTWHAPMCEVGEKIDTPIDEPCFSHNCEGKIEEGDQGISMIYHSLEDETHRIAMHLFCYLENTIGPQLAKEMNTTEGLNPYIKEFDVGRRKETAEAE